MIRQVAGRLHATASRLLRQARADAGEAPMSGARLSALSTIASRGPLSLGALAAAERVSAPTMSRLVDGLVRDGLVSRQVPEDDRRSIRIDATDEGRALLAQARTWQVGGLTERLKRLGESERRALLRGIELIEQITRD